MTTEILKTITSLPIGDIATGTRLRPLFEPAVEALIRVIEDHGFTVPILVRRTRKGDVLIDGLHRLTAETRRGSTSIPVVVVTCSDAEARALEASQNLAGAAMSPLDDALFLAAYSDAYMEMHPETKRGMAGALAKKGCATDTVSFAKVVAEKRGLSERHVRRMAAAGRMVRPDDVAALRRSGRVIEVRDLIAIAKEENALVRARAIASFTAAQAKSIRAALKGDGGAVETSPDSKAEAEFKALSGAFKRASMAARRRFAMAFADDLQALAGGEDGE